MIKYGRVYDLEVMAERCLTDIVHKRGNQTMFNIGLVKENPGRRKFGIS